MTPCVVAIEAEIVAKVYDFAPLRDVVAVDILARDAVAEAEEDDVWVAELEAEGEVGFTDEVAVDAVYAGAFGGGGGG